MAILDLIGGTRMVPLRRLVPEGSARVLLKLEYENPTGSMKDRMALAMVEAAEADGRLQPGGSVVEYTGGSTGVSLAFICAAKGIPLHIVTSDAFSREKRSHMAALGARLTLVPSPGGGTTKALTLEMIETARELACLEQVFAGASTGGERSGGAADRRAPGARPHRGHAGRRFGPEIPRHGAVLRWAGMTSPESREASLSA